MISMNYKCKVSFVPVAGRLWKISKRLVTLGTAKSAWLRSVLLVSLGIAAGVMLIRSGIPRNYVCGLGIMLIAIGVIWYAE